MANIISHLAKEIGSIFRFGVVGFIATAVYFSAAQALDYFETGPFAANLFAYLAGAAVSFAGHFLYTFGQRSEITRRLLRFLVVSVSGYVLSHLIVYVMLVELGYPFWLATLTVAVTLPMASWTASRYWAFA